MDKAEINFVGANAADASRLAEDLANYLKTFGNGVDAEVTGGSSDTMDLGATVVLVLGTPAVIALARGVADWIRKQGDPDLVIKTKDGSVEVKGGLDQEAKKEIILAALEQRPK
jgi:hypothetical protein